MDSYFSSIIEKLSLEDIETLNLLTSKESRAKFSALTKKEIFNHSNLSEAKFRKMLYRLEAMNFIEVIPGSKEHLLHVTEYGQMAIQAIYERSNA